MTQTPEELLAPVIERFSAMADQAILRLIRREEQVENLHDGMLYAMGLDLQDAQARGKRLRPVLCLATAEALGSPPERALGFAAAIELMHNFALVHDDIEDGDAVRRDRPSVHIQYGLAHGINIGDYLFCKVLTALLDEQDGLDDALRLRLIRLMSDTLDHTHVGQSLDISARANRHFSHEDYLRLVREKTGAYLAAPVLGGAMVAEAEPLVLDAIREYGHYIGPLFQITDDTLDLTAGKGRGGRTGSDIREGKRSFLVAEVTRHATDKERELLFDVLDKPRGETTDADVEAVTALYRKYQAVERATAYCDELLQKGLAALRVLPAPLEGLLRAFARSVAERRR